MGTNWNHLADDVLSGTTISREEALRVASAPDEDLLAVLHAAFRIRHRHHGREVRVHVLQNAKSGVCAEDCAFCSQSLHFESNVPQYGMQDVEELVDGAKEAHDMGAVTFCIVTATRGPTDEEVETVCEATRRIKEQWDMDVCASLGLLRDGQAERLAEAGWTATTTTWKRPRTTSQTLCRRTIGETACGRSSRRKRRAWRRAAGELWE